MNTAIADIRYALRTLTNAPAFTIFAVLALALGIGANTAIFSLVDALLLRPLQFRDPGRLVKVYEDFSKIGFPRNTPAPANYVDWKTRNHVFADMAAMRELAYNLTGDGRPQEIQGQAVSSNLFDLLGIRPFIGRAFNAEEDVAGGPKVALISYGLWMSRYAGDPRLPGKNILLEGEKYTVIGVMPSGFHFPASIDVWVPLALRSEQWIIRGSHFLNVVARLKPGVSVERAQSEMSGIAKQMAREHPDSNTDLGAVVVPLRDDFLGNLRIAAMVLLAAVACVLLIATANVANLLLARAAKREKEIAVRVALGASRARLIRQMLTESILLAFTGGVCGLLIAPWTFTFLKKLVPEAIAPTSAPAIDGRVLLFTLAVAVLTGVLFGLAPALRSIEINEALKQGSGRGATASRSRVRTALVIAEIALSTILLIGAGLMLSTLYNLRNVSLGFQPEHVLTVQTSLPRGANSKYNDLAHRVRFYSDVLAKAQAIPGVTSAGFTTFLPLTNPGGTSALTIEGAGPLKPGEYPDANHRAVTPDFLWTLQIPLIAGRYVGERDVRDSQPVVAVNQTMARQFWPNQNAIGRRFKISVDNGDSPWITIVGIVGDVRQMGIDVPARAEMYFPASQPWGNWGFYAPRDLAVRVQGNPLAIANAVRRAVWSVDPDQPVSDVQPMSEIVAGQLSQQHMQMTLLASFAALALGLAALGIYGVISYSIAQRTQEIGIRLALGAEQRDIVTAVIREGVQWAGIGLAIGVAGGLAASAALRSLLFGVRAVDPLTLSVASGVIAVVSLAACIVPAWRASRIDPMIALRYD